MIRLDRKQVRVPAGWRQTVEKALGDIAAFHREAKKFETLGINHQVRRAGFTCFAPGVLKKRRGKVCFPTLWGVAKEALHTMSHGKCSYCEGEINAKRSGQVEHFKPKSLFPSLAYEWSNYFLACGGCNGAKGDHWPEKGTYLRPDRGDPSRRLSFKADGTVAAAARDVASTIRDFDLNREWLVRRRKTHIEQMLNRVRALEKLGRVLRGMLAQQEWQRLKDPGNAYSAALTQCFVREWKRACPGERL